MRLAGAIGFALIMPFLGCSRSQGASRVETKDSLGVRWVTLPPLDSLDLNELVAERVYSTADGRGLELFQVADALFLADGTLVVANAGASELLFLDPTGRLAHRVGRKGDGPGEFQLLQALLPTGDGGVLAFDGRLSTFDNGGGFIETRRFDAPSMVVSILPLGTTDDGRYFAVLSQQRIFASAGERRDTIPLMVVGPDRTDTLGTWAGLERAFAQIQRGSALVPIGFARTAYYGSNGSRVAISSSDSIDITVFGADLRPSLRIEARGHSKRASDAEIRAWRAMMTTDVPSVMMAVWKAAPLRETLPSLERLQVDQAGRVWIGEYLSLGATERRWLVVDSAGRPVGQARLPALERERLPGRTEVLAAGRNRVAVLRKNEMGEESVEVWSFPGL